MASTTKVVASRLSSRLQPFGFKLNNKSISSTSLPTQLSLSPTTRLSPSSRRLPLQLSCVAASMLPLHSAIASARLVSSLSSDSLTWALVPQGISMPL